MNSYGTGAAPPARAMRGSLAMTASIWAASAGSIDGPGVCGPDGVGVSKGPGVGAPLGSAVDGPLGVGPLAGGAAVVPAHRRLRAGAGHGSEIHAAGERDCQHAAKGPLSTRLTRALCQRMGVGPFPQLVSVSSPTNALGLHAPCLLFWSAEQRSIASAFPLPPSERGAPIGQAPLVSFCLRFVLRQSHRMEITSFGETCLRLQAAARAIVVADAYPRIVGPTGRGLTADILTYSHPDGQSTWDSSRLRQPSAWTRPQQGCGEQERDARTHEPRVGVPARLAG